MSTYSKYNDFNQHYYKTWHLKELVFFWVGSNGMLSLSKIKNIFHQIKRLV